MRRVALVPPRVVKGFRLAAPLVLGPSAAQVLVALPAAPVSRLTLLREGVHGPAVTFSPSLATLEGHSEQINSLLCRLKSAGITFSCLISTRP